MKSFNFVGSNILDCTFDDSNFTHNYTKKRYPGITTILNKTKSEKNKASLNRWRSEQGEQVADYIFKNAGIIGRQVHKLNENYLNMIDIDENFQLLSYAHHNNFKPYLDKIDNICGIEKRLYSDALKIGGTADCVAEYDGVLSIIDYKSKRSKQTKSYMHDYYLQTTAYALMWFERTKQKIPQVVILASSEQNTMQEFIGDPNDFVVELHQRITQFYK